MKSLVLNLQELLNPINQMTYAKYLSLNLRDGDFWVSHTYSSFEMFSHTLKSNVEGNFKYIVDRNKFAKKLSTIKKLVFSKNSSEEKLVTINFGDEWITLEASNGLKKFEGIVGYVKENCLPDKKPGLKSSQICELNKNDLNHINKMGSSLPYEVINITRNIYFAIQKGILYALVTDGYFLVVKPIRNVSEKYNDLYFNCDLLAIEKCTKNSKTLKIKISKKENKVLLESENSKVICDIFKNTLYASASNLLSLDDFLVIEDFDLIKLFGVLQEAPKYYPAEVTFYEKGFQADSEDFLYSNFSGQYVKKFGIRPDNFLNMLKAMNIKNDPCATKVKLMIPENHNAKPMVIHCGFVRAAIMPYMLK